MNQFLFQLGRYWWWVQTGGSNIILVAITAWYSWLTFRLLRWNTAQAREQLRPNVVFTTERSLQNLAQGICSVRNLGERNAYIATKANWRYIAILDCIDSDAAF